MNEPIDFTVRFALFALTHSLLATNRAKSAAGGCRGGEPPVYRLVYNLVSAALFSWVMSAYDSSPVLYLAPGSWHLPLYTAQTVTAGIALVCLRQTGIGDFSGFTRLTARKPEAEHLITGGCYARMRHPLYFYSLLFMVLNPVMTLRWLLLTIYALAYFIAGAYIEERRLLARFGDQYASYRQRVPFLIPVPRNTRDD